jgi:Protein-arginine deiminase (PAD)
VFWRPVHGRCVQQLQKSSAVHFPSRPFTREIVACAATNCVTGGGVGVTEASRERQRPELWTRRGLLALLLVAALLPTAFSGDDIIQQVADGTYVSVGYDVLDYGPHDLTMTLQATGAGNEIQYSGAYDPFGSIIWTSSDNTSTQLEHHWTANGVIAEDIVAPSFGGVTTLPAGGEGGTFNVNVSHVDIDLDPGTGEPFYSGEADPAVDEAEATTGVSMPITYLGPDLPESFPDTSSGCARTLVIVISSTDGGTLYFDGTGDQLAVYHRETPYWVKVTGGISIPPGGIWNSDDFIVHTSTQFTGPVMLKARLVHATSALDAADEVKVVFNPAPCEPSIDLDIDSDNTNGFGAPDRNETEDSIEDVDDDPDKPGKLLGLNDDDGDSDDIPDFADGFDLDGTAGNNDDTPPTGEQFVPLVLELKEGVDLSTATLKFTYSASDPAGVTTTGTAPDLFYTPASGHLRIWTKNGSTARKKNSFAAATDAGDFVPADVTFGPSDLTKLGFTAMNRSVTLYVEAVRKKPAIAELQITAEVDPDGAGPRVAETDAVRVTILAVDIDVDTDRDGTIEDDDDEKGEDKWVKTRGAIFSVNLDRDGSRTLANGLPTGDAIHYNSSTNGAGFMSDESFVIEKNSTDGNTDDEQDITPFVIRKMLPKIPAGFEVWLKIGSEQQARRVHIFKKIKADPANTAIMGNATGGGAATTAVNITQWVDPSNANFQGDPTTKDCTFGIEGMFFRFVGAGVPANLFFEGVIDLTLELRKAGAVVHSDTVKLKVAPWIMLSRDQASLQVWAADFTAYATVISYLGYNNAAFLAGLAASGQLNKVVGPTPPTATGDWKEVGSKWFQDHLEIGYTQRPGGPKTHVVFRLPYNWKPARPQPRWPLTKLLGKGVGAFQLGQNLSGIDPITGEIIYNSGDLGGNLEILASSPLGRIAMGNTASPLLQAFLTSQEVQSPFFDVPVKWLYVGHIDEVTSFLKGFKVAIADPTMAWDLISDTSKIPEADRHKAVFFATGAQPVGGDVGGAIGNRLYDGPAIGKIITVAKASLVDGQTFTIKASATVSKTFELNLVGGVAAGNVKIDLTGATSANDVRDKIADAVNGAEFDVKAIANGSATVHLWNQVKGTGGNQAMMTTVPAGTGFSVSGMSGGKAGGRDFSTLTGGWKYLRTFTFTAGKPDKGQVAKIKTGGLQDGWVEIEKVWNTSSKIVAGGTATSYLEKYASKAANCPDGTSWFSPPTAGDKYVVVQDSLQWQTNNVEPPPTGTPIYMPAIVTVAEVLADTDFALLNTVNVQGVVDSDADSVSRGSFKTSPTQCTSRRDARTPRTVRGRIPSA